jgi:putative ATPase
VKEVRAVVDEAQDCPEQTVLFIDEIHRFTRSQQDAFLPSIERGTIALVGATTENPSFHLNAALLSRVRVLVLGGVPIDACRTIVLRTFDRLGVAGDEDIVEAIAHSCDGDVRALITMVEEVYRLSGDDRKLFLDQIKGRMRLRHDRAGDSHYDTISAFIKSLRASRVDAALFWGFRILEAGDDPSFLLRRMIIFASEDVGNADPRAMMLAVSTAEAFDRIGFPEAKIPIAQCITYLATAPKSNRSYVAMKRAVSTVHQHPSAMVPSHLKNAPTKLMRDLGNSEGYVYPHDCIDGIETQGQYLPPELGQANFYEPSERGYEKTIGERMAWLQAQIAAARTKN